MIKFEIYKIIPEYLKVKEINNKNAWFRINWKRRIQ